VGSVSAWRSSRTAFVAPDDFPGTFLPATLKVVERMSDIPGPIEVEEAASSGRYVIANPGGDPAAMYFQRTSEGLVVIDHTEVPAAFRGRGAGTAMVARAVEDARRAGERILPLCPFAAAQFRRHPEWADVLHREAEGAG